jgi:hypothetical protein
MGIAFLSHKVILIVSPQSWGDMLLAKHHYAIELAKRGNEVYFLNPPDNYRWSWDKSDERIEVTPSLQYQNLFLVSQKLFFPYKLKFHSRRLYNILIKKQIRAVIQMIPKPVDLLWSFDLGNLFPLVFFQNRLFKIFHPVDEPANQDAILAAKGADIIFSVTNEILRKYNFFQLPSFFINHGLADEFVMKEAPSKYSKEQIRIGMSGNLLRPDLDRQILLKIIGENPKAKFHFYGSYTTDQSNIGASTGKEVDAFIRDLKSFSQVVLHGVLKTDELAKELNKMDILLICYDIKLDQSGGTNYHKVMEYLSTGKTIISNNITTYQEYPEMIRMVPERTSNKMLPVLLRETIGDLKKWNAIELMNRRKIFAQNNTYQKQLDRIDGHICDLMRESRHTPKI